MPLIDGLEVCRQLKSDPATRLTPVVLVSGQTELMDRINGIEAGADDYLSKPVHPHELRARVRSLSRVKQLTDALDSAERTRAAGRAARAYVERHHDWDRQARRLADIYRDARALKAVS